jgi:ATP-binding cassette subfamily C protein CydC
MNDLVRIAGLWRGRALMLLLGGLVTLAALAAQLALSGQSALVVAGAAGAALLAWLGPLRVILRYSERLTVHDALFRAIADLRVWFFARLAARSAGGLGFARGGDVLARLVGDVGVLDGLYIRVLLPVVAALLLVPVLLVAAARVGLLPALAVAILFALAALALPFVSARAVLARAPRLLAARAGVRVAVLDGLSGLAELRAFGAEPRVLAAMQAREAAQLVEERAVARVVSWVGAGALLAGQGALLVALAASHREPTAGLVLVFLLVPALELAGLLAGAGVAGGQAAAAARRVLEVADAPQAVAEPAAPAAAPETTALRCEAIGFAWTPGRPVFDGLTLDIPAGGRIALLGASGSGKSSLAALLMKVAVPQTGRVLLGGTDLARLSGEVARARIGWLSQHTHLFDDTIEANLRLAAPDAPEAALWAALEQAHLAEFVRGLPDGLRTWVGEGGARLSGGQGRRLALARTLLTNAPILLLDEPCAGLDIDTERAFLTTLNEVAPGRTVVLIVHRLLGVERLDRIWRLSAGRAVPAAG